MWKPVIRKLEESSKRPLVDQPYKRAGWVVLEQLKDRLEDPLEASLE